MTFARTLVKDNETLEQTRIQSSNQQFGQAAKLILIRNVGAQAAGAYSMESLVLARPQYYGPRRYGESPPDVRAGLSDKMTRYHAHRSEIGSNFVRTRTKLMQLGRRGAEAIYPAPTTDLHPRRSFMPF